MCDGADGSTGRPVTLFDLGGRVLTREVLIKLYLWLPWQQPWPRPRCCWFPLNRPFRPLSFPPLCRLIDRLADWLDPWWNYRRYRRLWRWRSRSIRWVSRILGYWVRRVSPCCTLFIYFLTFWLCHSSDPAQGPGLDRGPVSEIWAGL